MEGEIIYYYLIKLTLISCIRKTSFDQKMKNKLKNLKKKE